MVSAHGPGPDRDVVLEALDAHVEESVELVAVYGMTSFDVYHVGDAIRETFADAQALKRHLSTLAKTTRSGFVEREMLSSLQPTHDRFEYETRTRDGLRYVRVYCEGRGILTAVEPEEPVEPLVTCLVDLLGSSP